MEDIQRKIYIEKENEKSIEQLKKIIPNIFDDDILNIDKLMNELQTKKFLANQEAKRGLNLFWKGKDKAFDFANAHPNKTISPVFEKSINFWNSKNLIIEGENLEVLKILKNTYHNKVDIIYIDPPFNNGNHFIYNDELSDEEQTHQYKTSTNNAKTHTNWLNMMLPRLLLAKTLLKNDGMIFISIDDNEYARLKIICDEIFGENNFISCMVWDKRNFSITDSIQNNHEYILMYSKNINNFHMNLKVKKNFNKGNYKKLISGSERSILHKNKKRGWTLYFNEKTNDKVIKMDYNPENVNENSTIDSLYEHDMSLISQGYIPIRAGINKSKNKLSGWTWSYEKANEEIEKIIPKKNNKGEWVLGFIDQKEEIVCQNRSILSDFPSSNGTRELSNYKIYEYNYSKNVDLLKYLIDMHQNKNAIVLDFFAGSGSTGQAVLELNNNDGGDRKFIMIQIAEKLNSGDFKTVVDIAKNRLEKVIEKNELINEGFKYFCLSESNINNDLLFYNQNNNLNISNCETFKTEANELNIIYEIILKDGLNINMKLEKFKNNNSLYVDEKMEYVFGFDKYQYKNIEDDIEYIWNKKNNSGNLTVYLRDDNFDDESKLNFIETIAQFDSNNQINIKVI